MEIKQYIVCMTEIDPSNGIIIATTCMDPQKNKADAVNMMHQAYLEALKERELEDNDACDENDNSVPGGCFTEEEATVWGEAEFAFGQLLPIVQFCLVERTLQYELSPAEKRKVYDSENMEYLMNDAKRHLLDMFALDIDEYDPNEESDTVKEADAVCSRVWGKALRDIIMDEQSPEMCEIAEQFLENYDCNIAENAQFDSIYSELFANHSGPEIEAVLIASNKYFSVWGCSKEDFLLYHGSYDISASKRSKVDNYMLLDSDSRFITYYKRESEELPGWLASICAENVSDRDTALTLAIECNRNFALADSADARWTISNRIGKYKLNNL